MWSRFLLLVLALGVVTGCTSNSYGMPEGERTRTYAAPFDAVWAETLRLMPELRWTVVHQSKEEGRIEAKTGFKMTAAKGYATFVQLTKVSDTATRVEVGAETAYQAQFMDTGGSKARVRELLEKLDAAFK